MPFRPCVTVEKQVKFATTIIDSRTLRGTLETGGLVGHDVATRKKRPMLHQNSSRDGTIHQPDRREDRIIGCRHKQHLSLLL
ncbi:hypothetical protein [Acetobacter oeni]|uniref:hypothetical protein n=1 Tax=Acetobacter oeni TaxID=304077 RepID=UPI0011BE8B0A|nr:hypothetical protein [Acetobacter oeni]